MQEMRPYEYILILLKIENITHVTELETLFEAVQREYLTTPSHIWGFKSLKAIGKKAIEVQKNPKLRYMNILKKHLGCVPPTSRRAKVLAAKYHHPDTGGDSSLMALVNDAIDHVYA